MNAYCWRFRAARIKEPAAEQKGALQKERPFFDYALLGRNFRQPMNPRLLVGKLARFGKTEGKFAALTPNQVARVAAY